MIINSVTQIGLWKSNSMVVNHEIRFKGEGTI